MPICPRCEEELPKTKFYIDRWKVGGYKSICKTCWLESRKEYNRSYRQQEREEWISFVKRTIPIQCSRCGYNKNAAALDFHHVNPEDKNFSISWFFRQFRPSKKAKKRLQKELENCVILCKNCHMELHYEDCELKNL